jgi:hypothetical protein
MKLNFSWTIRLLISILATLLTPFAWAYGANDPNIGFTCADAVNVMDCIKKTQPQMADSDSPPSIPLSTQQFGLNGPLGIGVRYDSQLGWIPEMNYVQMFYENGISLQVGYGAREQRANVTLGHGFSPYQQVKLTYEYLAQSLPFDFDSGSVKEWVNQNAFALAYRYLFPAQKIWHSMNISGYYIHANNKSLDQIVYEQNNNLYLNLRHLAGGTEETVTSSIALAPLPEFLIDGGAGYSHLVYNTQYENNRETTAIAYNASLAALLSAHTKFTASIANSAAETDSDVKISQIFPAHIEAAVTAQYSKGRAGQPDSSSLTVGLSYPVNTYVLPTQAIVDTLKTWIQKPVIRAPRVLVIKDEKVIQYLTTVTNPPPQTVATGQTIPEIRTQDIFNFDPALFDKVVYSLSDAPDFLGLAIKPDGTSVYQAIIYSAAPISNTATPNGGTAIYHVRITASAYKNGMAAPIESYADLELDVNFNPANEPQWDKNNTTGQIIFDQVAADPTAAINLNNHLSANQNAAAPKFYFKNPSQYPNWQIVESAGISYLTRATVNGAYTAADVNTTAAVTVYVKYQDDPENIPDTNSQTLQITVKPDPGLIMQWNPMCRFNTLHAMEPYLTTPTQVLLLFNNQDATNQCIRYLKNGSILSVANNAVSSINASSNYNGGISIVNEQLIINNPVPADLGKSWDVALNIVSAATVGTQSVKQADNSNLSIPVDAVLQVNGSSVLVDSMGFTYAVVYVNNSNNMTYTITSSQVNNPDLAYTINPYVCPGHATNPSDPLANCITYKNVGKVTTKNGEATLLWLYHSNGTPTTVDWVKLSKS